MMRALLWLAAVGLSAWASAALWFAGPGPAVLRVALASSVVLAALAIAARVRPNLRALFTLAALYAIVLAWWSSLAPSNERHWQPDVARVPTATFAGNLVTVQNVRSFRYRSETDFDPHWKKRRFDLNKLDGLDLFFSFWGSPAIAHTIMSWSFSDGKHLAVSIETRKEMGEQYSAFAGFFRQYELIYVAADESDVVKLRTNERGEEVYVYRLRVPQERARALLVAYLEAMNTLAEEPAWYNALTTNCTTTIRQLVSAAGGSVPLSWKILANGYLPELLYERGSLDPSLPFAELKARGYIDERALAATDANFSEKIREGVPMPPPRE